MAGYFINGEGIAVRDTRRKRRAQLVGHQDLTFVSREGWVTPAQHCKHACWDFESHAGDLAIVQDYDLEFLD